MVMVFIKYYELLLFFFKRMDFCQQLKVNISLMDLSGELTFSC